MSQTTALNDSVNPQTDPSNGFSLKKELKSWAISILIAVTAVFLINTFIARVVLVEGSSMEPTLYNNNRLITTTFDKKYTYEDIIVINRDKDLPLIKRVIGLPGDSIDIDFAAGIVYRNGEPLVEGYTNEPTLLALDFTGEVMVPPDCVFVLGDNRNHSSDSRDKSIGMINQKSILGKAIFRIYPFSEIGTIQ